MDKKHGATTTFPLSLIRKTSPGRVFGARSRDALASAVHLAAKDKKVDRRSR